MAAPHIIRVCGMPRQADTKNRMALRGKKFTHCTHFFGGASEAMHQQTASGIAGEKEGLCRGDNILSAHMTS